MMTTVIRRLPTPMHIDVTLLKSIRVDPCEQREVTFLGISPCANPTLISNVPLPPVSGPLLSPSVATPATLIHWYTISY